jgi:hypothetical protein
VYSFARIGELKVLAKSSFGDVMDGRRVEENATAGTSVGGNYRTSSFSASGIPKTLARPPCTVRSRLEKMLYLKVSRQGTTGHLQAK